MGDQVSRVDKTVEMESKFNSIAMNMMAEVVRPIVE